MADEGERAKEFHHSRHYQRGQFHHSQSRGDRYALTFGTGEKAGYIDFARTDRIFCLAGMFPVNYDFCNWKMLAQYLQGPDREKIPALTRAKLLHDSWNLAYAGELCFGVAMNMTLFLKEEKNHVVWEPVFTMIHHIGRRIEGLDVYLKFEAS